MMTILNKIIIYFTRIAVKYGVIGLGFGMFVESVGIPGASAVLELTAGYLITQGRTSVLVAILVSTIGLTAGSLASYGIGYWSSRGLSTLTRHKGLSGQRNSKLHTFLIKYGDISILLAQLFGTTRTWISIPAGAMQMNLKKFTLYTAIGGFIYCSLAVGISLVITDFIKGAYRMFIRFIHIPFWVGLGLTIPILILFYFFFIKKIKTSRNYNKPSYEFDR